MCYLLTKHDLFYFEYIKVLSTHYVTFCLSTRDLFATIASLAKLRIAFNPFTCQLILESSICYWSFGPAKKSCSQRLHIFYCGPQPQLNQISHTRDSHKVPGRQPMGLTIQLDMKCLTYVSNALL